MHLSKLLLTNKDISSLCLAALYLAEGSKAGGRLTFGNSDPDIIHLYLRLLRAVFPIEETKFRCTVQCRADQEIPQLERFWKNITKIPRSQFYATRIDPRSIGKPSKKPNYKGVCVVDYLSADVFNELQEIGKLICKGL